MLLITCADEYLGFCIASHLAQTQSLRSDIRVLCDRQNQYQKRHNTVQPWLLNFASKGMEVQAVNYMHPNDISQAMRNVDQMVITVGSHPNRVEHCQHLTKVALKSGVRSILLLSHVGGHSEQYQALFDYGLIENNLLQQQQVYEENNLSVSYTILRLDWMQQYLHFWSTQVERYKSMSLPMALDTEVCPIDISDVCRVIFNLVVNNEQKQFLAQLDSYHAGQVYTLTGPEALTSRKMVQLLSSATRYKHYRYPMARPMDTCYYLTHLGNDIWFDERIKKDRSALYIDALENENGYTTKVFSAPNGNELFLYSSAIVYSYVYQCSYPNSIILRLL
jgi:uncharacterized protein YbjT (DUF2867 family)